MLLILQISGSLIMILVCFIYINQIKRNQSTPNPGTWIVALIISGVNTITYFTVVNGEYVKIIIVLVSFFMICTIALYTFVKGKFAKLAKFDKYLLFVSLLVGIFWQTTSDARLANVAMQAVIFLSFLPIVVGLWQGRLREKMLSWNLAVLAYVFQVGSLSIDFNGDYLQLAYPVINGIIGNALIPLVIILKKKESET